MNPNEVVMWTCVVVFVVTALAALLQLLGVPLIKDPKRDAHLFKIIIAAIAVAAVGAFASGISQTIDPAQSETAKDECKGNNPPLECYLEYK